MKTINEKETVYEIYLRYPEIVEILYEFGFTQIKLPQMVQTAGRLITLKKGCSMRGFDYEKLKKTLEQKGFLVIDT